jgi:hypothetical protein
MFLRLDASIRNWIFIPITLITVSVNLLMKYLNFLFGQQAQNKPNPAKNIEGDDSQGLDFKNAMANRDDDIKIKNAINRAGKLRLNFMNISERGFKQRKAFFCKENEGFFTKKYENKAPDLMNPSMMTDMIKKNVLNGLYYALIFVGVGYMFSGFILLKLPFGLTQKFRTMLQQGLNLPDVDVSYVSAISWCFILVFGLNSILQHFDGGADFSMLKEQEQMMKNPMMFGGQQGTDYEKLFSTEKENIEIIPQFSLLDDSVERLIDKYEYLLLSN